MFETPIVFPASASAPTPVLPPPIVFAASAPQPKALLLFLGVLVYRRWGRVGGLQAPSLFMGEGSRPTALILCAVCLENWRCRPTRSMGISGVQAQATCAHVGVEAPRRI